MLTVMALDRCNGWAFVKEGERVLLVRPPYQYAEALVATEATAMRAVTQHGYAASACQAHDWAAAISWIREEVIRCSKEEGHELPEAGVAGRSVLRHAPQSMIEHLLERVKEELLPQGSLTSAEQILLAMQSTSQHLQKNPSLMQQTAALLEDVRAQRAASIEALLREDSRFPTLQKQGRLNPSRLLGKRVAMGGSLFAH